MTNEDYRHHEKLGDAYRSEGAFDQADAAYARALELRPDASWIAHKRARLGPLPDLGDPLARITLFVPYYTPRDPERAEELRRCLDMNLDSGLFSRVVLLVDDETVPHRDDGVLQLIRLGKRPGYLDWVLAAERLCPGQIALLANSDIYCGARLVRTLQISCAPARDLTLAGLFCDPAIQQRRGLAARDQPARRRTV